MGEVQTPLWQSDPEGQRVPQVPQLRGSVRREVQLEEVLEGWLEEFRLGHKFGVGEAQDGSCDGTVTMVLLWMLEVLLREVDVVDDT